MTTASLTFSARSEAAAASAGSASRCADGSERHGDASARCSTCLEQRGRVRLRHARGRADLAGNSGGPPAQLGVRRRRAAQAPPSTPELDPGRAPRRRASGRSGRGSAAAPISSGTAERAGADASQLLGSESAPGTRRVVYETGERLDGDRVPGPMLSSALRRARQRTVVRGQRGLSTSSATASNARADPPQGMTAAGSRKRIRIVKQVPQLRQSRSHDGCCLGRKRRGRRTGTRAGSVPAACPGSATNAAPRRRRRVSPSG